MGGKSLDSQAGWTLARIMRESIERSMEAAPDSDESVEEDDSTS